MSAPVRTCLAVMIGCVLMAPAAAHAQRAPSSGLLAPVLTRDVTATAAQPQAQSRSHAVAIGAVIGAGAALGLTAMAAAKYGENEGGKFCGVCMVQWSVVSVPVGAGIGAAVGWGIARSRRSIVAVPMFSRKSAAVVISARF